MTRSSPISPKKKSTKSHPHKIKKARTVLPEKNIRVDEQPQAEKLKPKQKIRTHLSTYKKKYIKFSILALIIILGYFIYILITSHAYFVLNSEIIITHDPRLNSVQVTRGDPATILTTVSVEPFARCATTCNTTVINLLNNETKTFTHTQSIATNVSIPTPQNGQGNFFVSVETQCQNTRTLFCPSTENSVVESSLYAISYTLTPRESQIVSDPQYQQKLDELFQTRLLLLQIPELFRNITLDSQITQAQNAILKWDAYLYEEAASELQNIRLPTAEVRDEYERYYEKVSRYNQQAHILENITRNYGQNMLVLNSTTVAAYIAQLEQIAHAHNTQNETLNTNAYLEFQLIDVFDSLETDLQNTTQTITQQLEFVLNQSLVLNNTNTSLNATLLNASLQTIRIQQAQLNITNASILEKARVISPQICSQLQAILNINCTFVVIPQLAFTQRSEQNITKQISNISLKSNDQFVLALPQKSCCHLGKCSNCDKQNIPILFIHGHAFNKNNLPEDQMSAFAKLQQQLPFINGGIMDVQNAFELPPNSYANSNYPLTFRGTFYYINSYNLGDYSLYIQKSERIENYALRLRELIQATKYQTGSDQVIIVAHSMGGLVARKYVHIFGDSDVHKLITINTPHNGVTGRVARGCTWFGANKECDDMTQDSIFLRRIADVTEVYAIHSIGCDTDGVNGDGIVTAENAYLEGALANIIIEGVCTDSLQTSLHNDVLDADKYPEIVAILTEILSK